jgi:hypothetical protein
MGHLGLNLHSFPITLSLSRVYTRRLFFTKAVVSAPTNHFVKIGFLKSSAIRALNQEKVALESNMFETE